ncbi:hypothetical protein VNI00_010182 [Paramarasmius palmivorus]|uniref:Uncharacterized protein n=1 Tax=Paramarasmius palmivorus TaxID=297713 RepID=A0AAW0CJV7_9AGAR
MSVKAIFGPASPSPQPQPVLNHGLRRRPRPKGLWKARVTLTNPPRCLNSFALSQQNRRLSNSSDDSDNSSISLPPAKKLRATSPSTSSISSDDEDEDLFYIWDFITPPLSPLPLGSFQSQDTQSHCPNSQRRRRRRAKVMDTSSVATKGQSSEAPVFDLGDWRDLKDMFTKAAEQYESSEAAEALPIIRGVIHECHRCLKVHHDPSLLFVNPSSSPKLPPTAAEKPKGDGTVPETVPRVAQRPKRCTCVELPTAFHAIFGTALFLFGNLIQQDPTLALPGEPDAPSTYWLAALDVFETGENLPSRTHGLGCDAPEDWRMAIVWGRTLVCLADETITRQSSSHDITMATSTSPDPAPGTGLGPDTPFAIIAQRRPPITGRTSLATAKPNDLLKLAMDQFSRGIFHMPHPSTTSSTNMCFSRAKELYTIASEVLLVASKLSSSEERRYWAEWADSVFNQMQMGLQMELSQGAWKGRINRSRGECLLIVGSALAEEIEDELEKGGEGAATALGSEDAVEAREVLGEAVVFFERAKGVVEANADSEVKRSPQVRKRKRGCCEPEIEVVEEVKVEAEDDDDLQSLLTEALLTLANLTVDETKREELYARAEKESRTGLGLMEVCSE